MKTSTRAGRFPPLPRTVALLLMGMILLSSVGAAAGQEDLYQEGNRLYQEGDFTGALQSYQGLLEEGFESGDLHFNLGNAFFKTGELGRAILSYERALKLTPRNPDARANLELARSLTADEIEPMPRFWALSFLSWWVHLLPRGSLIFIVTAAYLVGAATLSFRILTRGRGRRPGLTWTLAGAGAALLLFGTTLLAREEILGGAEWGVILVEEVAVQSAPSQEDDLTLFHVHEGTKVRLDQRTADWSEVVLEDGRVGWVPTEVLEGV
jgi:tetratricopeptide (TPR) repeat protein